MKIKEKAVKVKNWVVEHKKLVIGGAIGAVCAGLVIKRIGSASTTATNYACEQGETDFGRDMLMQFVYQDTGELMEGVVPCTELYAKECIEMMEEA